MDLTGGALSHRGAVSAGPSATLANESKYNENNSTSSKTRGSYDIHRTRPERTKTHGPDKPSPSVLQLSFGKVHIVVKNHAAKA